MPRSISLSHHWPPPDPPDFVPNGWLDLFEAYKQVGKAQFGDECRVAESRFLTGKEPPTPPRKKAMRSTIDWVLKSENLLKCQEGNYDDDRAVKRGLREEYGL